MPTPPSDIAPLLPAQVSVEFATRRCGSGVFPDGAWPARYVSTVSLADAGFPGVAAPPGTTLLLRSTAVALYSTPAGPATNKTALDALAKQLATDLLAWRGVSFDIVYNGVVSPAPSALIDVLEITHTAEDQTTRLQSQPWDGEPQEYAHLDSAQGSCLDDDRIPGILMDIPGGTSGTSARAVLSLEDGRLWRNYDSTVTVGCGCTSCAGTICLHNFNDRCSPARAIAGATFTVTQGVTTIGTCTTDGTGSCCVPITASGSYNYSVAMTGMPTVTGSVSATCATNNVTPFSPTPEVCVTTFGCQFALPDTLVSVTTTGGIAVTSGTTDSSGKVTLFLTATGTYDYSATCLDPTVGSRYGTTTGTFTISTLGTTLALSIHLTAATGYVCVQANSAAFGRTLFACPHPIKTTLNGTIGGTAVTLTFDPTNYPIQTNWAGTYSKTTASACGFTSVGGVCTNATITAPLSFNLGYFINGISDLTGTFQLAVLNTPCTDGGGDHVPSDSPYDGTNSTGGSVLTTSWTCSAFSVSGTIHGDITLTPFAMVGCLYGGDVMGTVTE